MFDEENLISPATFLSFCPSTWGRESPDAMSLRHPDTSLPYLLGRSSLHHAGRASAVQNSFPIILSFNIIKIFFIFFFNNLNCHDLYLILTHKVVYKMFTKKHSFRSRRLLENSFLNWTLIISKKVSFKS